MYTLTGTKKNSIFGTNHTTTVGGSKKFFTSLSKTPDTHKVMLGYINNKSRHRKNFVKCYIYKNCLEFKIGFNGVQTITVMPSTITPKEFLLKFQKIYKQLKVNIEDYSDTDKYILNSAN